MPSSKGDDSKSTEFEVIEELTEQLESVTLDKEMAEEKVELLQNELESHKLRVQELETELELKKTEMEDLMQGKENAVGNFQVLQLEQQNGKMKEALIKMRDMIAQANLEKEIAINERVEFQIECEQFRQQLEQAEETIKILKEQVDASIESEKMIDILTNKNLGLEDKLRKAEEEIKQLEEMRLMDEEMVETQKEIARGLREDLDKAFVENTGLNQLISTFDKRASEYDEIIHKFQSKIEELNESLKIYKGKENTPITQKYEEQLDQTNEAMNKLRTELARAHKEKDRAVKGFEELQAECKQAHYKAEQAEAELKAFKIQVDAAKNSVEIISKQETEIVDLKRVLKAKNDDIGSLKVRISLMEKKLDDYGNIDQAKVQQLQQKYDELAEEFEAKQNEFNQKLHAVQLDLDNKEMELIELRLLQGPKKSLHMAHLYETDSITEQEYFEVFTALQSSQHRIRKLEVEASKRLMNKMRPLEIPSVINGPLSFRLGKNSDDLELEQMIKESEQLLEESNKYLVEPVDPKQKLNFRNSVVNFNRRVVNLKFRFQRFWNRTHPGEEFPRILTKLNKNLPEKKKLSENPIDRCKQILEKWKCQIEEDKKVYGNILNRN